MAGDGSPRFIQGDLVAKIPEQPRTTTTPPTVVAKRVYIPKQLLLRQALQVLAVETHEIKACIVGNNQVLGSVCIDVPAHNGAPAMLKQKFFGDYSLIEEEAVESASLAALTYLQKAGIISVDDANFSQLRLCEIELISCQRKLLAASSWATMFQEQVESLQTKLVLADQLNKKPSTTAMKSEITMELPYTPPSENIPSSSQSKQKKRLALYKPNSQRILFQESCTAAATKNAMDDTDEEG